MKQPTRPLRSAPNLHPLQGERQIPAYPPEIGEGSSDRDLTGQQPRTDDNVQRPRLLFTLSKGRGRFGRLRPKPVRGLPFPPQPLAPTHGEQRTSFGLLLFTLSKGRGRTCPELAEGSGRLRPKSVKGLPIVISRASNHVRTTTSKGRGALHALQGERQSLPRTRSGVRASSAETGEGSSRHPPWVRQMSPVPVEEPCREPLQA